MDTDSKPIPGAKVSIQNAETGYSRNVLSDSNGKYRALVMPVGTYTRLCGRLGRAPLTWKGYPWRSAR